MEKIKQEESEYQELPKFYNFKSRDERERILYANFNQVTEDVNKMVKDLQQFFKRTWGNRPESHFSTGKFGSIDWKV